MKRLVLISLFAALLVCLIVGLRVTGTAEASPAQQGYTVHVVQPGETLYSIAMRYGVSAAAIASANNIYNPDLIYAGQSLVIPGSYAPPAPPAPHPAPGGTYVVQLGDTLSAIAWKFGTTVSALMAANNITNPNWIYAGQVLVIPGAGSYPPSYPPNYPPSNPPGHQPPPHEPPACGFTYTVCHGDTVSSIAARYHTTVQAVARANGLSYPYVIYPGQRLHIPCGGVPPTKPPTPGKLSPAACAREVQIVQPLEGQHLTGVVQIVGSAKIADFQFYKLEYASGHTPLDTAFHSINDVYRTPAWDTVLGTWYVDNMPNGAYTLRLTAVDNRGQFPAPCNVHVYID